jgi:CheY-like chemotaxis protein
MNIERAAGSGVEGQSRGADASLRIVTRGHCDVVVVHDERPLQRIVVEHLNKAGHEVTVVPDLVAALARARAGRADVVVAGFVQARGSGLDFAEALVTSAPRAQVILTVASRPSTSEQRRLAALANTRLIAESAEPADFLLAVRQAAEVNVGFRGSVFGVSLLDIIQLIHGARRSVSLYLTSDAVGALHFSRGELVHAEVDSRTGVAALETILTWSNGSMHMSVLASDARTIKTPFQPLLLDSLRRIDEARAQILASVMPEDDDHIAAAIERALREAPAK